MTKRVEFPEDHLIKTFDDEGRIIEIEYLLSGKKCQIEYTGDCWGCKDIRHITWSDDYEYMTNEEISVLNSNGTGIKKGWKLVEKKNPNSETVLVIDFDDNNKIARIEKSLHGKTIFKRETGDWGFDGRIRADEMYITMRK